MADAQGRATLADNMLALYAQYGLDGIDIDWEYPSQEGSGGNIVSAADSANFLAFLRTLRATLPPNATITAATQTVPFAGADGNPMGDVSEFARVLDWVLLMNYDTWGCECSFLPFPFSLSLFPLVPAAQAPIPDSLTAHPFAWSVPIACMRTNMKCIPRSIKPSRAKRATERRVPELDAGERERSVGSSSLDCSWIRP